MKLNTLTVLFIILLISLPVKSFTQVNIEEIGMDITGENTGDQSGYSVSMPDRNTVAIGARYNNGNGSQSGQVRVYKRVGSSWVQKGIDIDGEAAGDESGFSVSMPDSNTLAIGARYNSGNGSEAGHVRIYRWSGSSWIQKGIDIDAEDADDELGYSISMPDSNTVAIGAVHNDGTLFSGAAAGHVRIYYWNGASWVQKGVDIDGTKFLGRLGYSVSMPDPNTVAMSAPTADSGQVYIYHWSGSSWTQKGNRLVGEADGDQFGYALSMPDSNTIAIGARYNGSDAGHTRIYHWSGSSWIQKGIDIDGAATGDQSGFSVSMSDSNTIAIGAPNNKGGASIGSKGHVRIFEWKGGAWQQKGSDINGTYIGEYFGFSVSMPDSNTVGIGAISNTSGRVELYSICTNTFSMISITACDSYTWPVDGQVYTVTGTYLDTIPNSVGCDSIITLNLTINQSTASTVQITSCDSFTWSQNGMLYSTSGMYQDTVPNSVNCDSVITLDLTINQSTASIVQVTSCDSYVWSINGQTYMMTGTYQDTIPNSVNCDSVITLDLTINQSTSSTVQVTSCDSYTWSQNGMLYSTSGLYQDTIQNSVGCDSVITLDLTINQSTSSTVQVTSCDSYTWSQNGMLYTTSGLYQDTIQNSVNCDSVITLDLTINQSTSSTVQITSCNSYTWPQNGMLYSTSGMYQDTIPNSANCDSVITLDLTINQSTASMVQVTSCDSYVWPINGQTYTVTGTYQDTIPNSVNCDSVITLDLTINQSTSSTVQVTSCDSYTWPQNGILYSTSGMYQDTIPNSVNCDSVITLDLTINQSTASTVQVTSCNNYTWVQNGMLYTSSGLYQDTIPNSVNCDSVITLDLTINQSTASMVQVTSCDSYVWPISGQTYTVTGTYQDTILNAANCDSVITLDLTINQSTTSTVQVTSCDNYTWSQNGMQYTTSGMYKDTIQNSVNCDSVITLDLTIKLVDVTVNQNGATLTSNQTGAAYQWLDCNNGNSPITGEIGQAYVPVNNGDYAVEVVFNNCTDTSACINVNNVGIEKQGNGQSEFYVYPNPSNGIFYIKGLSDLDIKYLELYDLTGKLIKQIPITSNKLVMDLSYCKKGVFMIRYGKSYKKIIITD